MSVEQRQRHQPPPATHAEFRTLLAAGVLITTGGKPLIRVACRRCGGALLGSTDGAETCWCAFACPACQARVGQRCRRPSEHTLFGDIAHADRIALARADIERRALAGDPDLPARWPANDAPAAGSPAPDPGQPALW